MTSLFSPMELQQALGLPSAGLTPVIDETSGLRLWLLDIDADKVEMNAAEIGAFWQQLPFWAFAWAAGRALAGYIGQHPECVRGKRVLDFGCGSGIAGLAAAKAGAEQVYLCDLDPVALQAAECNAALNHLTVNCLDAGADIPAVDIVLAADVLYDISSSSDLQACFDAVPEWLLAERRQIVDHRQLPQTAALNSLAQMATATLPAIGDFDAHVLVDIYHHAVKASE